MTERPIVHILGNGTSAYLYEYAKKNPTDQIYTCNLPPFAVDNVRATFIVDFKMCKAMVEGSVVVPGKWIMGARPKKFTEMNPSVYLKWAPHIKEFYLDKPDYAANYTDFNCGHMAVYYAAKKLNASRIHMYGFDSIFNLDITSISDFYLNSDRSSQNSTRLAANWRPIWQKMFEEFSDTRFDLYYMHAKSRIDVPSNVHINILKKK